MGQLLCSERKFSSLGVSGACAARRPLSCSLNLNWRTSPGAHLSAGMLTARVGCGGEEGTQTGERQMSSWFSAFSNSGLSPCSACYKFLLRILKEHSILSSPFKGTDIGVFFAPWPELESQVFLEYTRSDFSGKFNLTA